MADRPVPKGGHPVQMDFLLPFTELLQFDTKQSTMASDTLPGLYVDRV